MPAQRQKLHGASTAESETPGLARSRIIWQRLVQTVRVHVFFGLSGWTLAAGVLALLVAFPLLIIGVSLFEPVSDRWEHLVFTQLGTYVTNSVILVLGVGLFTLLVGVSTAWLVAACDFPGRRFFEYALVLPLALPTYLVAITYAGAFGFAGSVYGTIQATLGNAAAVAIAGNIMSREVLIIVMGIVLYPYVYLISRASFMQQSHSVLEVARLLGRSPGSTFLRVSVPLARPAIAAGLSLVLMEVLNDYGAAKYFGVQTFTTGIFRVWSSYDSPDAAVRLAGMLLLFVILIVLFERMQRGHARYDNSVSAFRPGVRYRLRGFRAVAATGFILLVVTVGFFFPVGQLLYWAAGTPADLFDGRFLRMVLNSFGLAAAATALCVLTALILVYTARLHRTWLVRTIANVSVMGYAVPGAVIAIGVLLSLAWLDSTLDPLLRRYFGLSFGFLVTGSVLTLLFAYLVRFIAVSFQSIESGFQGVAEKMDESARSLGAGGFRTLLRIDLPLIRGPLLAAGLLAFVDILKELPLTLMLRPFNFDTLATRAFELAQDEMPALAAGPALLIVAIGLLPVFLINSYFTRNWHHESAGTEASVENVSERTSPRG
jgi:iron(III) transport system permease protein